MKETRNNKSFDFFSCLQQIEGGNSARTINCNGRRQGNQIVASMDWFDKKGDANFFKKKPSDLNSWGLQCIGRRTPRYLRVFREKRNAEVSVV
jgi:hypothetical protein